MNTTMRPAVAVLKGMMPPELSPAELRMAVGGQGQASISKLPPTGSVVIAAPLKIQRGSGSPVRALALVA